MARRVLPGLHEVIAAIVFVAAVAGVQPAAQTTRAPDRAHEPSWIDTYREPANRLINEATKDAFAWRRLGVLTDTAGHRLSGSPGLERAIKWTLEEMKRDGLDNVHTEPVMVPKWVRGAESA